VRDPFPPPSGAAVLALVAGAALLTRSSLERGFLAAVVDGFDLVVHEAGHPILGLLGSRFLMFLGGTLAQLALPVAAAAVFAARRQPGAFAAAVVWVGINLVNVGRYAADAEVRVLPLLAADVDAHDWWNMLGMLGLRAHAAGIGGAIAAAGWTLQALGPGWALGRWLAARLDAAGPDRPDLTSCGIPGAETAAWDSSTRPSSASSRSSRGGACSPSGSRDSSP